MIPILDLKKQISAIRQEIDLAIKKVIDRADFVSGEEVGSFESRVVKYTKAKYAIGVSNGTDAIRLALLATGVKPGDGVICPSFTYYATAGAIASIAAVPVFADIDPETYNISGSSIEKVIKHNKKLNIKAVIPVHLYGQCADMDAVLKISGKYHLKVIEDAAQAFGADYLSIDKRGRVRKAGTMGDCGAVSFFPGKNIGAFGDAGAVLTNSRSAAEKLKLLRNQGNKERYYHLVLGHNHRLDTIQAAILEVKLKYLDSWNKARQKNAAYYNQNLRDLKIKLPLVAGYNTHIYHQYVLRLCGPSKGMVDYLRSKGIDARVYYPVPLHLQKCFRYLRYKKGDFPESENAALQTLAIPVYPDLTQKELDYIIRKIKEYLKWPL